MIDEEELLDSSVMAEEFSFRNSLLFYTLLKMLVQCKLSETKLIRLQEIVNSDSLKEVNSALKIKKFLLSLSDIVGFEQATRSNYETLVNTLRENNIDCWKCCIDLAVDLLLIKDLILQESKAYINNQIKKNVNNISDKLSMQYDISNIEIPYGLRVACSLMSYAVTDINRDKEFILANTNETINNLQTKVVALKEKYKVTANNVYSLIVGESVNQSIVSDAGSSYESRFNEMILPVVDDISGHTHDSKIPSVEYDFILSKNNKKIGVSAKRTLRERYKQNFEDVDQLDVDYMMLVTLGTDLNEEKMKNILQREKIFIIVASENYDSKEYLKNNSRVISSKDLSDEKLNEIIK